ncbi:hypothetical protein V6N13_002877 [Hibiscus sabdariffa]
MEKKTDSCSPTGVLEDFFKSKEFERSHSCKESNIANEQNSKQGSRWRGLAQLFRSKSKKSLANLQSLGSFRLSLRSSSMRENVTVAPDFLADRNSNNHMYSRKVFALSELRIATKNFGSENLVGKGGYAEVYKGEVQRKKLTWGVRFKIALGTAEGLRFVISGLAKWLPEQWTHHTVSKFEGTFGYLAPEYLMHGIIDEKTDVFAFGVLLLELVTGRRALDYSQQSLVLWAKPLLKKNDIRELIDPALGEYYSLRQVNLVLLAASMCIHRSSIRRPQMNQAC